MYHSRIVLGLMFIASRHLGEKVCTMLSSPFLDPVALLAIPEYSSQSQGPQVKW